MHFETGCYSVRFIFSSLHHRHVLTMQETCVRSRPKASQLLGSLMGGLQRLRAKVASRTLEAERTGKAVGVVSVSGASWRAAQKSYRAL